jgi:hypothetical protein
MHAALYIASGAASWSARCSTPGSPALQPPQDRYSPAAAPRDLEAEVGVDHQGFPSEVGGPGFNGAGPCPWTRIMPTGGVDATRESLEGWFKAGVACVGVGSNLITKDILDKKDFTALTTNVRQVVDTIKEIRAGLNK